MAQLMDLMKNQRKRKNIFGQEIAETRPMSETAQAAGLRAQPTDAVTTGQLGGTPKQQEMAGAKQTQDAALQQAQKPALGDRLVTQQRQQQAFELPQSGDTVEAARGLIESAAQARQQRIEDLVNLPEEVKAVPEVAELIKQFEATTDPAVKSQIAGQLNSLVAQDAQGQTFAAIEGAYQDPLTANNLAANYFEDPEEYNNIVSTLTEAGIDLPDNATFEQLETKIQEYSDSVTGQIDQAMDMLDDPSAPAQLKETARQALRDLGASQLIATDYELENLTQELESRDEYTVTVDGTEVTGNLGALLDNPVVSGAATAFLSELTAVPGADPQQREANRRALLDRKSSENPDLEFLYRSVFENASAYESALEREMAEAQPVVDILDKNAKTRQEVIDVVGYDLSDLMGLGLQLNEYDNSLIQMVLDPANAEAVKGLKRLQENGIVDQAFMSRVEALPQEIRGEQVKRYANAALSFRDAKALQEAGLTSDANERVATALEAVKLPQQLGNILGDMKRNPSRYSAEDRAVLGRLDPDNTGSIDPSTLGDSALNMLLEGVDFAALPRVSARDSMRTELSNEVDAILNSPDYRRYQIDAEYAQTQGRAGNVILELRDYRDQLQQKYASAPSDVREAILGQIETVDNDIAKATRRLEDINLKARAAAEKARVQGTIARRGRQDEIDKERGRKALIEAEAERKRKRAAAEKALIKKAQRKYKTSEKGGKFNPLTKEQMYQEVYRITRPESYRKSKYNKPKVRTGRMERN